MAKCIGFTIDWGASKATAELTTTATTTNDDDDDLSSLITEDTIKGEEFLSKRLEDVAETVLDIASNFLLIKQTIEPSGIKLNCTEVRDCLLNELKQIHSDTCRITNALCNLKLSPFKRQKYFILYSSGVISSLQELLQIVGRLSELEQKVYLEEQQKAFISGESLIIHALTSIWLASINIMHNFQTPGRSIFSQQEEDTQLDDDYNFADQMEFTTSSNHYVRVFITDLLITSWIQFNRLVKFDDLIKGLPLLCPCHCKTFFTTLRLLGPEERSNILAELLPLVIDYRSKPSLMTESIRQHNIVPFEPCYSLCDQQSLAYFVVWNVYSLSRVVKPQDKPMIINCKDLLESSYSIAMKQFEAIIEQPGFKLSPHQEERHKLLTHMRYSLDQSNAFTQTTTTTTTLMTPASLPSAP